jgi:hypothetical protein
MKNNINVITSYYNDFYKLCTQRENPNVETLHKNGLYVGNSQYVTKKKIDKLFNILSGI